MSTKRTYQPSKKRKSKTHGFRQRIKTNNGNKVLKRRLLKGREKLIP